GVGVALGEVAHALRHLHPDEVAHGGGRFGPHPAPAPARGLDDPALPQGPVGRGDGVGVDPEPLRQLPEGRQRLTGAQRPFADPALDAGAILRLTSTCDPIFSYHKANYALVQWKPPCRGPRRSSPRRRTRPPDAPSRPAPPNGPPTTRSRCTRYSTRAVSATSASSATAPRWSCPPSTAASASASTCTARPAHGRCATRAAPAPACPCASRSPTSTAWCWPAPPSTTPSTTAPWWCTASPTT